MVTPAVGLLMNTPCENISIINVACQRKEYFMRGLAKASASTIISYAAGMAEMKTHAMSSTYLGDAHYV